MCSFTMAQMGLTIASGVAQYGSQVQAAKAQAQAQQRASAAEVQRVGQEMSAMRLQESQDEAARALEGFKAQREAESIEATTITAGAEGMVSGNAVGLLADDVSRANAEVQSMLALQERLDDSSRAMAFQGTGLAFVQNMNRINRPTPQPDLLGTLIGTASGVMGAAQSNQMRTMQRETMGLQNQLYNQQLQTGRARLAVSQRGPALQSARTEELRARTRLYDAQARAIGQ